MYENDSDSEEDVDESDKNPNPKLSQGSNIPRRYGTFPIHLANTPIVDIDPFFKDKRTFIVVSNSNRLVCPKSYTHLQYVYQHNQFFGFQNICNSVSQNNELEFWTKLNIF